MQEQPDERDAHGNVWGKGTSFHIPSRPTLFTNFHEFTSVEALQIPSFWGLLWRFHCIALLDQFICHWCLNSISISSSLSSGWEWEGGGWDWKFWKVAVNHVLHRASWPLEERISIRGQRRGLTIWSFLRSKVLLKYNRDRESFWHRYQKGTEKVPPC